MNDAELVNTVDQLFMQKARLVDIERVVIRFRKDAERQARREAYERTVKYHKSFEHHHGLTGIIHRESADYFRKLAEAEDET